MERIYSLRLDIKNPDIPFKVTKSICTESGDLIQVFSNFQLQLVQLLKELKEEEILAIRMENDDIPF